MKALSYKKSFVLMILLICMTLTGCGPSTEELLDRAKYNISTEHPSWYSALELIKQIRTRDQDLEEVRQLREECYFQLGCEELFIYCDTNAAAENFTQCVEHPQADAYLEIAQSMMESNFSGTLDLISQLLQTGNSHHSANEWIYSLQKNCSSENFQNMTLEEHFDLETTLRSTVPACASSPAEAARQIAELFITYDDSLYDLDPPVNDFNNYVIEGDFRELYNICLGADICAEADNAKKVLIVRAEKFAPNKTYRTIAFDLMRQLPSDYQPASLEEVNTILTITNHYNKVGSYTSGKRAYRLGISWKLECYGTHEYTLRYKVMKEVDTIWGADPPSSIPSGSGGRKNIIADPPNIQDALSDTFQRIS